MRTLLLFLLAINLALFGWQYGAFGPAPPLTSTPGDGTPIAQQINPGALRVTATDTEVAKLPSACMDWGGFVGEETRKAEEWLATLTLGERLSAVQKDDQASWIVYLPPHRNRAEAENAATRLRAANVADFFIIQDSSPLRLAISLGVFKSEEAAKTQQTALQAKGIANIRIGQRPTTVAKTWFHIRDVDPVLRGKIESMRTQFPNQEFKPCA